VEKAMSVGCPGQTLATKPEAACAWPARRALLASPLLLAGPARAQPADDSLKSIVRNGVLRVSIGFWTAEFVAQEHEAEPRMHDAFHEGMARLIGQQLGVRTEILPAQESGDGMRRLLAGEVDCNLAPPITRGLLRAMMFCTPHLSMDLVVVRRGAPTHDRRRAGLHGMRLATLNTLAPALAERGTLQQVTPVASPWLLVRRLLDAEVDGIIVTNIMARAMIRHFTPADLHPQFVLTNSVFAGAVAYGAHDLLRATNAIIEGIQLDGSLPELFRRATGLPLIRPFSN
jgi:hypothetical protein